MLWIKGGTAGRVHRGDNFEVREAAAGSLQQCYGIHAVALATHDHDDTVAHSVNQTYESVRKLGSTSSIATIPPTISTTSN